MRFRLRTLALILIAAALVAPGVALAILVACVEDTPRAVRAPAPTVQDVERLRRVLGAQDPRRAPGRGPRTIVLGQRDVDVALDVLAERAGRLALRAALLAGALRVSASVELPRNPVGRYVNVDAEVAANDGVPRVARARIGRLPLPPALAEALAREGLRRLAADARVGLAADVVDRVRADTGRLAVTLRWDGDVERRLRAVLLPPDDLARLRAHQQRLADTIEGAPRRVSLAALAAPLFALALERAGDGDVVPELRAAIAVLALHANGRGPADLDARGPPWPIAAAREVTLAERVDTARHWIVSAAIAAWAGTALADALGLWKEVDDSRGGSGFSFSDLAADRAGARFGELAAGDAARARRLAREVSAAPPEGAFLPRVSDLPEGLGEAEFARRYGGVDAPATRRLVATIDARIAALPLLR